MTSPLLLAFTLGLSLSSVASAAPPAGVSAPGLETICADMDGSGDTEVTLEEASDALQVEAAVALDGAAALLGATLLDEGPRVATVGNSIVFAGKADPPRVGATTVVAFVGTAFGRLSFGGSTVEVAQGSMFRATHFEDADTTETQVTVYDAAGSMVQALSYPGSAGTLPSKEELLVLNDADGMDRVVIAFMYGDIIMGGMPLDDFED
jgi:hypothetical protein